MYVPQIITFTDVSINVNNNIPNINQYNTYSNNDINNNNTCSNAYIHKYKSSTYIYTKKKPILVLKV